MWLLVWYSTGTNSVKWQFSSSHIYDETSRSATALDLPRYFPIGNSQRAFTKRELTTTTTKKKWVSLSHFCWRLPDLFIFYFFLRLAKLFHSKWPSDGTRQKQYPFLFSAYIKDHSLRTNKSNTCSHATLSEMKLVSYTQNIF